MRGIVPRPLRRDGTAPGSVDRRGGHSAIKIACLAKIAKVLEGLVVTRLNGIRRRSATNKACNDAQACRLRGAEKKLTEVLSFGPFRLLPIERRLERNGVTVKIGNRPLEILVVLANRAGELVSNQQLIEKVWPNSPVDGSQLRVHMATLQRSLGDDGERGRYIANVRGRGYRFVVQVSKEMGANGSPAALPERPIRRPEPARTIGRAKVIGEVVDRLLQKRFVTLVGPGGIGKTTVALAVAEVVSQVHGRVAHFVDLGILDDPGLIVKALALAIGIGAANQADDPAPRIKRALKDRKSIIIFDCCEHLVEHVAQFAEELFLDEPSVMILATSRESLRASGEHVYLLAPLEVPPQGAELTAKQALRFPAVQLFVERASAGTVGFELSDTDATSVGRICRQLDGIALAIELAAGRAATYGIEGILSRLEDRFRLLTNGETSLERHKTLQATIDWSFNLLSAQEKVALRRLSIFSAPFSFEAAQAIAKESDLSVAPEFFSIFANLVAKSLVASDDMGSTKLYRLLDSTRQYMRQRLSECGESWRIADRHANYYRRSLPDFEELALGPRGAFHAARCAADLANTRTALQWCFSQPESFRTGIGLVAASAPLFLEQAILSDCLAWVEQAIDNLEIVDRGGRLELRLQTILGLFLIFVRGNTEEAKLAILRGLELAQQLCDDQYQARLTDGLYIFHLRRGDLRAGLNIAYGESDVSSGEDVGTHDWMRSISASFAGNHDEAIAYCEKLLQRLPVHRQVYAHHFSIDHRVHVYAAYARSLWVRGFPERALAATRQAILEAGQLDHPVSLCIALVWAIPPTIWAGELVVASEIVERLTHIAKQYLLTQFEVLALGWQGALLVRTGEAAEGLTLLQQSLQAQARVRHALMRTSFLVEIAVGQLDTGEHDSALATIDEVLHRIDENREQIIFPEALRIKAEIILAKDAHNFGQAGETLERALDHARGQSALSWELRSAISLTRAKRRLGADEGSREPLSEIVGRFTEGFETADLRTARALLD